MGNPPTVSPPLRLKLQRWLASTPRLFTFASDSPPLSSSPASRPAAPQLPPLHRQPTFKPFAPPERTRRISKGKGREDSWDLHVQELADGEAARQTARARRAEAAQLRGGRAQGGDPPSTQQQHQPQTATQPPAANASRRWSLKRSSSSSAKSAPRMRRSMSSSSSASRWSFLSINTSTTTPPPGDSSPGTSHEGPASSPGHDMAPLLPLTPLSPSIDDKERKKLYRHSVDVPGITTERLRGGGRKDSPAPSLSPARLSTLTASIDTTLDADGRRVLMSKRRKSLDPTWAEGADLRDAPIISQPPVKVKIHKDRFGIGDDDDTPQPTTPDEQPIPTPSSPATPSTPSTHTPTSWLAPPTLAFPHDAWAGSSWTGSIIVSSPGSLSPVGGPDVSPSADGLDTLVENHSWSTVTSRSHRRWSAAPAMPSYNSSSGYTHPRDRSEEYYRAMLPPPRPLYDHPMANFAFPPGPPSPSASSFNTIKTNFPLASAPPTPNAPTTTFSTPSRHVSVLRRANKPIARAQTLSIAPPAFSTFRDGGSQPGSPTGPPLPSPTAVTFRLPDGHDGTDIVRRVTSPTPPRAGTKVGWARPRAAGWMQSEGARARREASTASSTVEEPRGRLFVANPDASSDSDEDEPCPVTPVSTPASSALRRPSSLPPPKPPAEATVRSGSGGRLSWTVDNTLHPNDYRTLGVGQIGMAY